MLGLVSTIGNLVEQQKMLLDVLDVLLGGVFQLQLFVFRPNRL
jgi:hypothetical protein